MATGWRPDPVCTIPIGDWTGMLPGAPPNLVGGSRPLASKASRFSSVRGKCVGRDKFSSNGPWQEQEQLWQYFFVDPSMWWGSRPDMRSSRSPDFRRNRSGEVLWLNNMLKPASVDEQLVSLDMQMGHGAATSKWNSPGNFESRRRAGWDVGSRCSSVSSPAHVHSRKCAGGDGIVNDGRRQEEELLWQQFFMDPSMWWDNRREKKSSRSPDFRSRGYDKVLWLNNMFKPAWVDEQLSLLDMQMAHAASPSESRDTRGVVTAVTVSMLCEQGKLSEAVGALESLAHTGSDVSQSLFYTVLKLCTDKKDLVVGRRVHDLAAKLGYESSAYLGNHVLRIYACEGKLEEAMDVFTRVGKPNVLMWFSIISAHAKHGKPKEAIQLYHEMRRSGVKVNGHVFVATLQACALAADLESGRKVHRHILRSGTHINLFVGNCLVDMYAKCGQLQDARQVFESMAKKDVVTWNALIAGYAQQGLSQEAFVVYGQMEQNGLILANHVTFACLLKACASTGALQKGRQLHLQIVERGLMDNVVLGTCLVDMYAKCGEMEDARQVFDSMATKDVVTWNALIAGYTQQGLGREALLLYAQMEEAGLISADHVTFACLLKACGSSGALQKGRQLHSQLVEKGLLDNAVVGTCLVDMYAKCGELEDARQVFDRLVAKDVVTWNALISGYGACDAGRKALACFEQMLVAGVKPDDATFTCLLVACSHEGLVREGRKLFDSMSEQHGIEPTLEHHNCMIDLLGRAGHLDEAEMMLLSREGRSNAVGLRALLNACKIHGDIERATWCFKSIVTLDPRDALAYVLMANAYADAGRWSDVDTIETRRRVAKATKKPAVATIEVDKEVHRFLVGDRSEDIALKLESTNTRAKQEGGHVPHTKLVLKPWCEQEKEDALCGHAEKLALAFGLLHTPSGTPLGVTKNLRMCSDCHSSTEIMSRLERRDIVVRDGYRVHRFADGCCSCKRRP